MYGLKKNSFACLSKTLKLLIKILMEGTKPIVLEKHELENRHNSFLVSFSATFGLSRFGCTA